MAETFGLWALVPMLFSVGVKTLPLPAIRYYIVQYSTGARKEGKRRQRYAELVVAIFIRPHRRWVPKEKNRRIRPRSLDGLERHDFALIKLQMERTGRSNAKT